MKDFRRVCCMITFIVWVPGSPVAAMGVGRTPAGVGVGPAIANVGSSGPMAAPEDQPGWRGLGIASGSLEVTPDTLRFGEWPVGAQPALSINVHNTGPTDVHVGPITISGPQASSFSIDSTQFTLSSQEVRRLNVVYVVQGAGPSRAVVTVASDSGSSTVGLEGNGTAVTPPVVTRVGPSDPNQASAFGRSVGIRGLSVIVGASPDLSHISGGAAFIFGLNDNGWEQRAQLSVQSPTPYEDFGAAVDISGYHAIVGDPLREDQGGAYIFTFQGGLLGGWELTDTLGPTMSFPRLGRFGSAAAIDGDFAIVGAPNTTVGIIKDVGVSYVFRAAASPGVGGWHLQDSLIASDANRNLRFGLSVDISDEHAIIGTRAWGAYIFKRDAMTVGTRWLQTDKLISSDYEESDYFGTPVAIDGDYALVAAPFKPIATMTGVVYVFKRKLTRWEQVAKITSPFPYMSEQLGTSVALSGDLALIAGESGSSVYLFRRTADTLWTHVGTFDTSPDKGGCVALDAESKTAVIGHSWSSYQGYMSGSANIYSGFGATAIDDRRGIMPSAIRLFPNYPNPFNPGTTITFELPTSSDIRLSVYDVLGREVAVLVNERRDPGAHEVRFDGSGLSSGVYLYRLQAGDFVQTRKLLLLQ